MEGVSTILKHLTMGCNEKMLILNRALCVCVTAMIPDYWNFEGGQSATGALIEHLVQGHPISPMLANRAGKQSEWHAMDICTLSSLQTC